MIHTVSTQSEVVIRAFEPADAAAFYSLNEQWISKYFRMEELDHINLGQPQQSILEPGGHIYIATVDGKPVGCCALIPEGPGEYELAKMAVAEGVRGLGIGRRILEHVIVEARALGAKRLTLFSNSVLANAVHLYESLGFQHLPLERVHVRYTRSNVAMELDL